MYFKFEPLFCNFEVMQRIQTCKLVNGKARWPFFVCFFVVFFQEKNSLLRFVILKLIIFSKKRQFCFGGVLTLICIFYKSIY